MNLLFIFPPQWSMNGVASGVALLSGVLKECGHTCNIIDINIDFYNHILSKQFIEHCKKRIAKSTYKDVLSEYEEKKDKYNKCIKNIDVAIKTLRNNKSFYNMKNLLVSYYIIDEVLSFVSLAYHPFKISRFNFTKKNEKLEYKDYKLYTSKNIFSDYLTKLVEKIRTYNADYIGISVSSDSQMIAALTLAKILKKEGLKSKIIFGGANITRQAKYIKNDYELFEKYIDGALVGNGQTATIEYIEYLEKKRSIEEVSNLIYKKGTVIKENPIKNEEFPRTYLIDYSYYDKKKYFLPDGVLLITTSESCYYNKCAFCLHNKERIYKQRSADNVIKEIKECIKKNKVNKFFITDNALNPIFADEFSKKIIEQNIKIYYSCDIRFEKEFDERLLKQLYASGLRVCYWGLESANNRVLNFLKKGTTIERNKKILQLAHNVGIFNFVYFMLGIPTETKEEMYQTVKFMIENKNIINSCLCNEFNIMKGSDLYENPHKYGLTQRDVEIEHDSDICPTPLRKISLEEIKIAEKKVYSVYNNFYNNIFRYGNNDLILLYKSKEIPLY